MFWESVISALIPIALIAIPVWLYERKTTRYGGYTDKVRIRFSPVIRKGCFRNNHPEDNLYTDDNRINREWKP